MVYCGKPSKSCHACRQRKTRCDAKPLGCSQCARTGRKCPGYRSQVDLIFRDQSSNVIRKAKARAKAASKGSPESSSPDSLFDEEIQRNGQLAVYEPQVVETIYSLNSTIEERATCYFIAHYATGVLLPGTRGMNNSDTSALSIIMDPTLTASMSATSLASFAHYARSSELAHLSRYHYTKAIQLTNAALASPEDAVRDSTLLSTILLGLYEFLTGRSERSMKDWAEHVRGAAALLMLRGRDQFHSSFTRRMFLQATTSILASCMQRSMRLPKDIVDLLDDLSEIMANLEEFGRLGVGIVQMMIEFNNLRCDVDKGVVSDPAVIFAQIKDLDQRLADISDHHPLEWRYDIIHGYEGSSDIVFRGSYHVYGDVWVSNAWNSVRMFRILTNQYIRDALLRGFQSKPPMFTGTEYSQEFQRSTDMCYAMQAEILASVPQSLGYVRNTGLTSFPQREKRLYTHEIYDTPAGPASSGYNLLWPLWYSGFMDLATEDAQHYCIDSLERIGNNMGIAQAFVLAQVIRTKQEPKVWSQDTG